MGHDAFFSYAHVDNQVHGDFIRQFRKLLIHRIEARLKINYPGSDVAKDGLDFFIDHEGLPANGDVSEILKSHVRESEFLFIFVGRGYLQSQYCQKERTWFREAFSENEAAARDRTFIVFLTKEALSQSANDDVKNGDLRKLRSSVFWNDFGREDQRDAPLEPFLEFEGRLQENPRFRDKLDKIAKTYVDLYPLAVDEPISDTKLSSEIRNTRQRIATPVEDQTVAVGAVTNNLREFRDKTVEELRANKSLVVDIIEYGELADHRDHVTERLRKAGTYLQIFDYSPVRGERRDPPGGHLEVQKALLPAGCPFLPWLPPSPPAITKESPERETNPEDLKIINELAGKAQTGRAAQAAAALLSTLHKPLQDRPALILVECTEVDANAVRIANSVVTKIWNDYVAGGMRIGFPMARWDAMEEDPNFFNDIDGIIVIDRSKQVSTLFSQVSKIRAALDQRNMEIEPRLFVLPPSQRAKIFNLPFIVFRERGSHLELPDSDREELRQFLVQVKERATLAAAK